MTMSSRLNSTPGMYSVLNKYYFCITAMAYVKNTCPCILDLMSSHEEPSFKFLFLNYRDLLSYTSPIV